MKKHIIIEVIASLFILLFLYTALMKLIDHASFKNTLRQSPLMLNFASIVTIILPIAELLISLALFFERTRKLGLYGSLLLMSLFSFYVGYMIRYSPSLPCSCGGIIRQMNWHQHLYFNVLFSFLALAGIWLNRAKNHQDKNNLAFNQ